MYDGEIAWYGNEDGNNNIYYWDGTSTTKITDTTATDYYISLYNGDISWSGGEDGDFEIYYWDGINTTKLTNTSTTDYESTLYNGEIAWAGKDDGDMEIYYARLASAWIQDALPEVDILDFTESEIMALADMYSSEGSGVVGGMDWTYLDGDLPGDTDGEVYEIGDSWIFEGNYYIKLGSGLEGTSGTGAVPEVPFSSALVLLTSVFVLRRKKKVRG